MHRSMDFVLPTFFLLLTFPLLGQSPVDLTLEIAFNDTSTITFMEGTAAYGMLIQYDGNANALKIIPTTPNNADKTPSLIVDREEGFVSVGRKGDDKKLLVLNSERSWAFSQFGTGSSTALKLSAANPDNNNKHFIIDTDGFVGIRDDAPVHQLSLGSGLARTKLALHESSNNTTNYGMGVTSGRFHFNLGNSSARYQFNDGPGTAGAAIFTIEGSGNVIAPGLEGFSAGAPMIYDPGGGEIGFNTSSRRFKINIKTLEQDWTKLMQVRPVIYNRPASPNVAEIGYIAEELDSVGLGKVVGYDDEGLPLYVNYDKLVIYLAEMVKLHHADLAIKQQEIELLTAALKDVDRMRSEISNLKMLLKKMPVQEGLLTHPASRNLK